MSGVCIVSPTDKSRRVLTLVGLFGQPLFADRSRQWANMNQAVGCHIHHFGNGHSCTRSNNDKSTGYNHGGVRCLIQVRPRKPGFVLGVEVYEQSFSSTISMIRRRPARFFARCS